MTFSYQVGGYKDSVVGAITGDKTKQTTGEFDYCNKSMFPSLISSLLCNRKRPKRGWCECRQ